MLIGGHLTPALAVAQYLIKTGVNDLVWVGTKYVQKGSSTVSFEYKEVTGLGIPFIELQAGKIWRKWTLKTLLNGIISLLKIPLGFFHALSIILRYQPDIVMGFGGYLQPPLLLFAKLLNKRTAIHEQTITAGTSNLACIRCSDIIFVSWPETLKLFPQSKSILTGNPVREFLINKNDKFKIFDNDKPILLVTGGNQGANTINWRLLEFLPKLLEECNVIHQVGNSTTTNDYEKAQDFYETLPLQLKHSYKFFSGDFSSDFAIYLNIADLLVCRAGANTVTEILTLGKRAILIPIPWSSQEEQLRNAEMVERTGLGYILKQYDAMPSSELYDAIKLGLLCSRDKKDFKERDINIAIKEASILIKRDASKIIVEKLLNL